MSLYRVLLPRNRSLEAEKCCWCLTVDWAAKLITGLGIVVFTVTLFERIFVPAVYYYAGDILFLLNCAILAANITLFIALFINVFQDKALLLILWLLFNFAFFVFVLLELLLVTMFSLMEDKMLQSPSFGDIILTSVLLVFYMHFMLVMLKYYKNTTSTGSTMETSGTVEPVESIVLSTASRTNRMTASSTAVMVTEPEAEAPAPTEQVPPEVQERKKYTGILAWLGK